MKSSVRKRALALPFEDVAKFRHHIYKSAFSRLSEASKQGFYIEAIALIESLLSDRIESRLSFLNGEDFSFKTLEKLIKKSTEIEIDLVLKELVEVDVRAWKDKRNRALHEMAKIEIGDVSSWDTRYALLKPTVDSGLKLLRKIDRRINKLKPAVQVKTK